MRNYLKALCLATALIIINLSTFAFSVTETHTNISCNGGNNGTINLTASGGNSPYTYIWSDGANTEDRTGLTAGLYAVTVTDNIGVTAGLSVIITEPTVINTSKSITNVSCGGGNNGAINLTVVGGTPGYTYMWSDFVTTEDRINITAALYKVTITDGNGCVKIDSANVTQPSGLVLSRTVTNVTCGSGANGAINLTVQFGTSPYNYVWSDGATTEDRSGIASGNYTVSVTDALGCSASISATVGQSGGGMSINTSTIQPSCFGGSNGTINITSIVGSVSPYTFLWNDAATTQNRTAISAGSYNVTVTSSTGCTASTTVNLGQPTQININLTPINVACYNGSNGAINTTVSGGSAPYSYNWGGGVITQNRTALSAGTYTVTVTDSKGCQRTATTSITQPLQLISNSVPSPLACTGGPTGSVMTNVIGGIGPYFYNWGGGITTPNRVNVNAGTYTVTVTDANGCTATASSVILPYTPLTTSSTQVNNICNTGNNGSINLTVSNGKAPYSYLWSNGATTQDIFGLIAGTYTVTVTDSNSCTITRSVTITQPGLGILVNSTVNDVSCFGLTNGAINITASNGTSPYTYNWGGGITSQNRTGLAAGNYSVTVTDNIGCSASANISVSQPSTLTLSTNSTNASCPGVTDGNASVTANGGFAPYTYLWSNASTSGSITVSGGTYNVTVTDNHSCSASGVAVVGQNSNLTVSGVVTHVTCAGGSNGAINLTAVNGNTPYTYNWGGGVTSEDRTLLNSGSYTVTVTDNTGCSATSNFSISDGATVTITSTITNVSCNNGNNGAINVTVSGVNSPFTYNWGGGVTTEDRNSLSAGNYNVTVTDNAGCTAIHSASVNQATTLAVSSTQTNATCNGGNNGSINVTVSGGNSPYLYNWGGGVSTEDRTNLSAGTYNVTVTDNNLCTAVSSIIITEPGVISISAAVTNVACAGGNNGAIDISVSGGTGAYTYNWGGGITTQDRTSLTAGSYTVTVSDANSCSASLNSNVIQNANLTIASTITNVSCFNGSNGAISLAPNGGTAPYFYNWGGGINTQNRSGLTAGAYQVTVTDNFGCSGTHNATVTQPSTLSANIVATNVSCNGGSNGSLNLTVSGGSTPYTYNWGSGITTEDRNSVNAGTYIVTITDANSCTVSSTSSVTQPTALSVSISKTNALCNGQASGSAAASVSGGTSGYSYLWSNSSSNQTISNIAAGNYNVTVSDANTCTASATTSVTQPSAITMNISSVSANCFGSASGAADLTVSGGTGSYSYLWSNGASTQDLFNVVSGNYIVTVYDANACSVTSSTNISQPTQIALNPAQTNISCSSGSTGSITLAPTGGSSPYIFNWSNGGGSSTLPNLAAGNYTVTVVDNNSCSTSQTYTITQSTAPVVTLNKNNITCNGAANGSITTVVTGGSSPFTFMWNDGNTSQNRTGLSVNTYSVTVTGSNNCSASATASVTQPVLMTLSSTKSDVVCNGANTGSIDLTVTGGTSPYNYNWSNGWGTQDLSGVAAGAYSVTVSDANACTSSASQTISQPGAITIGVQVINVTCNGASNGAINTNVSGGNGSYVYNWSNGSTNQNLTNATAGAYTLTVQDAQNCQAMLSMNILQPSALTLSAIPTNIQCSGGTAGSVNLTVSGGANPYSYTWSNGATSQDISNLTSGTYTVTVADGNNCSATLSSAVTAPTQMSLSASVTNVTCHGLSNGSVNLTVTGGTSPVTYNWGNNITSQNRSNVPSGTYTVTVTDASSCNTTLSATVTQPSAIVLSSSSADATCFGSADGSASVTATGGSGSNYQFIWSSGETVSNITNKAAGNYIVSVTDGNNCQVTSNVTIHSPAAVNITETHNNVTCNGANNGTINITVSGGNGSFSYAWNNNVTSEDLIGLAPGSYTVTASDINGCTAQNTVSITEPTVISITETHVDYACVNRPGSINISVNGGTSPYTFVWNNSSTTEDLTGVAAGNYDVLVTDMNGCIESLSAAIAALPQLTSNITHTNLSCNGASNAVVDLTVSGGTSPYSFVWNNSANTEDLANLSAGTYDVVVTDINNCITTNSATVTEPNAINITPVKTDVSCFGNANGSISVTVTGGTSPFTYSWSNNAATPSITSLSAGTFSVAVTDANNCTQSSSITVIEPAVLSASSAVLPVGCSNVNDGAIDLSVSGGTAPYNFTWNNGRTTEDVSGIAAGNYSVVVTDANGCTENHNASVGTTPPLNISGISVNTACAGVQTGSIDISVTGGTPSYSYSWNNGENTEDISNLGAGAFNVVVTDTRNCSAQADFNLAFDYELQVVTTPEINIDLGTAASLTANTNVNHNNTYQWTPVHQVACATCANTDASPTYDTKYTVTVVDENGCSATGTTLVTVNSVTDIFIPNAFSPNNDGNNDVFQLYGDVNTIQYLDFKVFNRWGEVVFSSSEHNFQWDGTYKGQPVDRGAYIYTMNAVFINGYSRSDYKGSVTIIR